MPGRITVARKRMRAQLRKLKQPLYDTAVLEGDTANNTRLDFFKTPQGQPITAGGANKTACDTNLDQASSLGDPLGFDLYAFQLEVISDGSATISIDNLDEAYKGGVFKWKFGQQRPWLELPVTQIPNGPGIAGTVTSADATTPTEYAWPTNGAKSVYEYYDFSIAGNPVPIEPMETFNAEIQFPTAIAFGADEPDYRFRLYALGVLYAAI